MAQNNIYYTLFYIMCIFKRYRDIFGEVGKGVHSHKFLGVILVDNALTIILAALIAYFTKIPFPLVIIATYLASIIIHYLFGVPTQTLADC